MGKEKNNMDETDIKNLTTDQILDNLENICNNGSYDGNLHSAYIAELRSRLHGNEEN